MVRERALGGVGHYNSCSTEPSHFLISLPRVHSDLRASHTSGIDTGWGTVARGRLGKKGWQHGLSECKSLLVSLGLAGRVDVLKLLIGLGVSGDTPLEVVQAGAKRAGSKADEDVEVLEVDVCHVVHATSSWRSHLS